MCPFAYSHAVPRVFRVFKQADMELKEVVHCRLAMLAFSGMVTQAVLTNSGFPYTG